MYRLALRFNDDRETPIDGDPTDLREAIVKALEIANRASEHNARWVRIYRGNHLEIAVSVIQDARLGA